MVEISEAGEIGIEAIGGLDFLSIFDADSQELN
jgi:hypothetical protein